MLRPPNNAPGRPRAGDARRRRSIAACGGRERDGHDGHGAAGATTQLDHDEHDDGHHHDEDELHHDVERLRRPLAAPAGSLPTGLVAKTTSTTFNTADHMLASGEMQVSGEPFAELLGRSLGGYNRFSNMTDLYTDPVSGQTVRDLLGWSLAIPEESYEYSRSSR